MSQSIINKNLQLILAFPGPIKAAWRGCTGAETKHTQHRQPSSVGKEQLHPSGEGKDFTAACTRAHCARGVSVTGWAENVTVN